MPDRKISTRPHRRDVAELLIEQLNELLGTACAVTLKREKPWASITFSGTRHYLEIQMVGGADQNAISKRVCALPDHEFALPGYFVADLLIRERDKGSPEIQLEILTIVDPVVTAD